ncbi:hypothetical protein NPIL_89521 [Nephila pilipes]|uniref:Nucleic-acid-binding protein n=1 Tax=Nephila pilipes TaxID=299642 RepID=A0A8X6N179_NEPPI|nr:hypothetical protein NPIL_89521 [Nephila pilipes]
MSSSIKSQQPKRQKTEGTTELKNKFQALTSSDVEMQTTPSSTSPQPSNSNQLSISTPGQILNQSQVANLDQTKKIKVLKITIDNPSNTMNLLKELQNLTGIKVSAKLTGSSLKIFTPAPAACHTIKRFINQNNLQGYTYQLPNKKFLRIVIRGMTADMPPIEIINDLKNYNIHVQECFNVTNKKTGKPMPYFY